MLRILAQVASDGVPVARRDGELFSEYAARFRQANSLPVTVVVSLANDSVGYLATDPVLGQGGLEDRRAFGEQIEASRGD